MNPKETRKYHEEADKLAAMLLLPHDYMKDHLEDDDKEIADALDVPEGAVRKRKIEVDNELHALCYGWPGKNA
jgi:Zn-dependent peptidase ImmA (M78 family)